MKSTAYLHEVKITKNGGRKRASPILTLATTECIKKRVLKPHCGLGSGVKRSGIPWIGDRFPLFAGRTSTRIFMLSKTDDKGGFRKPLPYVFACAVKRARNSSGRRITHPATVAPAGTTGAFVVGNC